MRYQRRISGAYLEISKGGLHLLSIQTTPSYREYQYFLSNI